MSPATERRRTNRLIKATSPYLLQHAHNPVDWYEWGDEALRKAREEDHPIFLSIGYAACHWCHVMEHESFEDEAVAAALNASFVSIKVDREERPDLDELYMAYTQALTKHGGWPMSVWLAPDGTPFYAGTYFPREQFLHVLTSIADAWKSERERITRGAGAAQEFFAQWAAPSTPGETLIPRDVVDGAAVTLADAFDGSRGGISGGGTNKFPPSLSMELMLRVHRRTGKAGLFDAVRVTLDHMARGGIYDHIGGGICRYSTDVEWLVPHFEKMLYDQALVSGIYLDAFQASRDPLYAEVAADILDYVLTDLRAPEGAFYSSRDADSEGLEGKFYIWTVEEVKAVLGEEEGRLFCVYYDVTETGNWFERLGHAPKGPKNILHIAKPLHVFAKLHQREADDLRRRMGAWREKMRVARARRTPPALDDKVLTGWNGLMIAALAKAGAVLDRPAYAEAAAKAAEFILNTLRRDGRLRATYRNGEARLTAYLSDYAFLTEGLLNLYEATFDRRWLDAAVSLTETSIRYYFDEKNGGFFFTASDAETLLARSKQPQDGAIPSGNSVQALNLLRLGVLLDRRDFRDKAESIFRAFGAEVQRVPFAHERLLCAADFLHDNVKEIVLIGDPASPDTRALVRTVHERYLPNKVLLHAADAVPDADLLLLKGKTRLQGKATAYVCEKGNCKQPVTTAEALARQLDGK
ncbi:MAG: thioredoxin domain-containing protein [Planctomycetes bacterium]|nr:thioredoxin domain-containing protein [Planctomycetota bacterium]